MATIQTSLSNQGFNMGMQTGNGANPLRLLILLALLALAVLALFNRNLLWQNIRPWQRGQATLSADLRALTGRMSESDVVRFAGEVPLRCDPMPPGNERLGDRVCHAYIRRFDEHRAYYVAFFFRDGRLASMKVDVPWWLHGLMETRLIAQYGPPQGRQLLPTNGERLEGWQLPGGAVFYNRDPDLNPLQWNTVYWMSAEQSAQIGGAFVRGVGSHENTPMQWMRWLLGRWVHG
ncbi:hypothetical protein G3580_01725 [Nitrogeniibacter mangrovi]|uniref:Uncharacterized protein n=1 Tax=Nitrogeniibacter mangrovi TaxID=2016596 RepID=A0A6C1B0V3_9RHOO|nr:hypothetical protein [Nitrogeniibacter mangrovi]QID16458.1 hypothetical protein G3580_01725 [Nitrogeniibacter mangrovi]